MAITSKLYLGLPQEPDELLANGDFEDVTGDNFDDWTETTAAGSEKLSNGDLELVTGDNFDNWTEVELGTGLIEEEGSEVHGDSHAMLATSDDTDNYGVMYQPAAVTIGKTYRLSAWVKGDYNVSMATPYNEFGYAPSWTLIEIYKVADDTNITTFLNANLRPGEVSPARSFPTTCYFDDISLLEDYAGVEEEGTIVHGDSHAVKLGGAGTIYQTASCTAEARLSLSFWSKGTGTKGLKYIIYDVSNSAEITSGKAPIGTEWQKTTVQVYAPVDCESIKITFDADGDGPFYLDDASLLEYGEPVFTDKSADVMASPAIVWEYGISGTDPFNLVANTGIASFVLDNQDKEYSPSGGERIVGFEEGMDVKITLALDQTIDDDENLLENGSFEVLA